MIFARYIVPLALIGLSGFLLDAHRRAWRTAQDDYRLTDRDRRFARSQYLRRTQGSSLIGIVGAAIACYPLVQDPLAIILYMLALFAACVCMLMLAMLDVIATRHNAQRIENEQIAAQVKTAMKLRGAGKSPEPKE